MSLADQFQQLQKQAADFRLEMFGATASMDDAPSTVFPCYYSPVRSLEQLSMFGFSDEHDAILRVRKTEPAFDPTLGKIVRLIGVNDDGSDLRLRLAARGHTKLNPEHVFGCKAIATVR
ncbi:MAG TPA: hypothetical protein VGM62_06215 [Chthoniobacterales bacterium]